MPNELLNAFRTISKQQRPPRKAAGLTFSEGKMYDRALLIYSTLPADPAEIRAAFHCRTVSAERIYKALRMCCVHNKAAGKPVVYSGSIKIAQAASMPR